MAITTLSVLDLDTRVTIRAAGFSLKTVSVTVTSDTSKDLIVNVPLLTVFLPRTPTIQTMICSRTKDIKIPARRQISETVEVVCMNMSLSVPKSSDYFELASSSSLPQDLVKIIQSPLFRVNTPRVKQFATWVVVDNPLPASIRGMEGLFEPVNGPPLSRKYCK
jgi:hypothetical protein